MITRSFSADIQAFRDLSMRKLDSVMQGIADEGIGYLHTASQAHLYTGWFRASWLVSKNVPKSLVYSIRTGGFVSPPVAPGNRPTWRKGRNARTGRFRASKYDDRILPPSAPTQPSLGKITRLDRLVFSNAVPYAGLVEEKFGMMAVGVRMIKNLVARVARQVGG